MTVIGKFSHSTQHSLTLCALFAAIGGVSGFAYANLVEGGQPGIGTIVGAAIIGGVAAFELFVVQRPRGAWLRRLPLLPFILLSTLAWAAIAAFCVQVLPFLLGAEAGRYAPEHGNRAFLQDMAVSLGSATLLNVILRLRSLIGGRVLMGFLLGRYHKPVAENLVFMFLDLAGSTRLAETLGDVRVQQLIGRFFFDIAQPIAENGGITYRYMGDGVIVTWPFDRRIADGRPIQCVFDIQALVAASAARYQRDFGTVPGFRVGMHGGPVVAGEVGDDKREIAYFGDTINTAARLEALCKTEGHDFLVSADVLDTVTLPAGTVKQAVGEVALRGKAQPVQIFALTHPLE